MDEIIMERSGFKILNQAYDGLSEEQKHKVEGLYNAKQIDLVLNHGLPSEDVMFDRQNHFKEKATSSAVHRYVTAGKDESEKLTRFQEIMNCYREPAILMGNCELTNGLLQDKRIFRTDGPDAKHACNLVQEAYDRETDPTNKRQAAESCLNFLEKVYQERNTIQHLTNPLFGEVTSMKDRIDKLKLNSRGKGIFAYNAEVKKKTEIKR